MAGTATESSARDVAPTTGPEASPCGADQVRQRQEFRPTLVPLNRTDCLPDCKLFTSVPIPPHDATLYDKQLLQGPLKR